MSDMIHFYREAETEAYTAGYAAGAATVLRKIPWPEAPEERKGRWLNGFKFGQAAALAALDGHYDYRRLARLVDRYVDGTLEDLGT